MRINRLRWLLAPLGVSIGVLMITAILGCRQGHPSLIERSSRPASRIFEGFAYAGEDLPNQPKGAHVSSFLPFRLRSSPMPIHFMQGHQYYFHHPQPEDGGVRIANEVLAPRLRDDGFELTEGATPNGIFYRGFATFDYRRGGGITVWSIEFKRGGCVGVISYDSDFGIRDNPWPVVRHTWDPADYVMSLQGACDL